VLTVLLRVVGALAGAILMFALWMMGVLIRMPKPPVPPSLALTLTAPVLTALGFALGIHVVERLTRPRTGSVQGTLLWTLVGGELGALLMYPFGGMMAGFGIIGFGAAALVGHQWYRRR